jgi:hypothetical protein
MGDAEDTDVSDSDLDALDPDDEVGGDAAPHPDFTFPSVLVGPATSDQFNTIEEWIRPIACWRLDDTRFEFDSSFLKPGAARELRLLAETREDHPGATLSLFGHADPVGDDVYNKALSGRRARAIYGLLTRDVDIWETLFKGDKKCAGDKWGRASLETMLVTVNRDPAEAADLETAARAGDRKALYRQYMDRLCGARLELKPDKDFLARGGNPDLRGDVQGCSEFNAVMRFSAAENAELSKPSNKAKRNSENVPNRRVVGFLFKERLRVDPGRWPCPAAEKGPEACRKRFFTDHVARRTNQSNRRLFADDRNTFECRFYHRLAIQSPCETSVLTSVQRMRVRLRLVYLDPTDKTREHPFPRGYRVTAVHPDGDSRTARVGDDGRVRFVIDRPKLSFLLKFDSAERLYFASADPKSSATPPDKLVAESDLEDAIKEGFRAFKVPHEWSTQDSDWPTVESPLFDKATGEFSGFENPDTGIGSIANPVKMVLDPHWQYLRWVYFDRSAKSQVNCLPMIVEGFRTAAGTPGEPDTRSNWATDTKQHQALPWIRQDRPLPDKDVLIQLQTDGKRRFIETQSGGSRRVVTVDPGGAADTVTTEFVDKPTVPGTRDGHPDRLRFYDLPQLWRSRGYFARLSQNNADVFDKMAAKPTSDAQPLTFSLDDMVLVDENLKAISWTPKDDRVAIFSNLLHLGIASGLHRPDANIPNLSQVPTLVTDRNYLADHPNWTRLIVMGGSLFDVFDRRVPDSKSASDVVGARAAVRWEDGANLGGPGTIVSNEVITPPTTPVAGSNQLAATMTQVQVYFSQTQARRKVGRVDLAILRCCDVEGDVEIAVNLHYLRLNFDFRPKPLTTQTTEPTKLPAPDANFVKVGLQSLATRWNGPDGTFNTGRASIVPATGTPKLRVAVLWLVQAFPQPLTATLKPKEAHTTIDVFKKVRAFMGPDGRGGLQDDGNVPEAKGVFVLAHESGHADSLADEYIEPADHASYFQPGFEDYIPGSPFDPDADAMMRGNREVRPRHFWHAAEWLRSIYGVAFQVKFDGFDFKLPPHPNAPTKTFLTLPWNDAPNTRTAGGFFDAFLFRLGKEKYSATVLEKGPYDGILRVVVRMRCTFFHRVHDDLRNQLSKMLNSVQERMNAKFFVTGDAKGETFARCRLSFSPRFLVDTDSGDAEYHAALGVSATRSYQQIVDKVEKDFGTHFDVAITKTGSSAVSTSSITKGEVTFNVNAFDLDDDFATFFAAMVGVSMDKGAIDLPSSYLAIAGTVMNNAKVQLLK